MDTSPSLPLLHDPFGNEDPYYPLDCERSPRRPVAGEPVTLGVIAFRHLDDVWVEWTVDGDPVPYRSQGAWLETAESGFTARLALPAFKAGDAVRYRILAHEGQHLHTTEEFSFDVPGWVELDRVTGWETAPGEIKVNLAASAQNLIGSLKLTSPQPGELAMDWSFQSQPAPDPDRSRLVTAFSQIPSSPIHVWLGELELVLHLENGLRAIDLPETGVSLCQNRPAAVLLDRQGRALRFRQTFASPPDEAFYGFGERFNAFDQRGNTLDIRVYAHYINQGKHTYIPVPFFISSRGYGCYQETSRRVTYDLACADPGAWQCEVALSPHGAGLGGAATHRTTWFLGKHPWEIVSRYIRHTGRPALPPDWVFGLWMSSNDWNHQSMVLEQLEYAQKYGIPATVLVIEAWSDEATYFVWNDAQYAPKPPEHRWRLADFTFLPGGRWPDPKGMADRLHAAGMKLVLWQIPVQKGKLEPELLPHPQHDLDEAYMIEKGYCVRDAQGRPYRVASNVRFPWFDRSLVVDFTNPQAAAWWLSRRQYLLEEIGVDGFKTDGGEHLWGEDLVFSDGRRSDELINLYPRLYQNAYSQFANAHRSGQASLFSRAGFTGSAAAPCHWAGDESSTWEAFRASIFAGLSAGISGIPFWGWDIAGFAGEVPSAELYLRSTAMAAFCPIMQYHSDGNARRIPSRDRTPWNIQARSGDERVIPVFRWFVNVRMNLLPYIAGEARYAVEASLPMLRALALEYPQEMACRDYPFQYLFGRDLLVAPVVQPGTNAQTVYLPQGDWSDVWSGASYPGGQAVEVATPIDRIPVFVRRGAVLPLNLGETLTLGSPVGNALDCYQRLAFWVYPETGEHEFTWRDHVSGEAFPIRYRFAAGEKVLEVDLGRLPYEPLVACPGLGEVKIRLRDK